MGTVACPAVNFSYTVTASNIAGSSTVTISIRVTDASAQPSSDKNYIQTLTLRVAIEHTANLTHRSTSDVQQTVQYFDGLGRPLQTIQVNSSPDMLKDLVYPIVYDEFGREIKKYLPYATGIGDNGTYKMHALMDVLEYYNPMGSSGTHLSNGIARTEFPYAEARFEPSPLIRILEQGAAGDAWQPTGLRGTVRNDWRANNQVDFANLSDTRKAVFCSLCGEKLFSFYKARWK